MNNERIGDRFQQELKYRRDSMPSGPLDWANRPDIYKTYPEARRIELPEPNSDTKMPLDTALRRRRSVRHYSDAPISRADLSYLLWASTGIQRKEQGYEFRTAPSAGALYPIETYLVVNRAEKLQQGVYHYAVQNHALEQLRVAVLGDALAMAAMGQILCATAPIVFVWTAVFPRSKWKYQQRAYRYVYLDAGHIAENLALAAVSLGLGSCQIAALFDDEINEIIGVDGIDESVLYMSAVGRPR